MEAVVSEPARLWGLVVCVLGGKRGWVQLEKGFVGDFFLGHAVVFEGDHHVVPVLLFVAEASGDDLSSHAISCVSLSYF